VIRPRVAPAIAALAALAACSSGGNAAAPSSAGATASSGTASVSTSTMPPSTPPPTTRTPPTTTAAPTTTTAPTTTAAATTTTSTAPAGPRTSCTSVVHIGDSTSIGLMSPVFLADPALRIDAQYARVGVTDFRNEISGARSTEERLQGQENALEVAARERAGGYHGCWVVALGTTDAANIAAGARLAAPARIDRMLAAIGDEPVLWVDVKTLRAKGPWSNPHMSAWNADLVAATARHPNLRVYDWAAVVQDAWFQRDGIHYTSAGYAERAHLIADALAAAFPA
jgi:hypothetical protein